MRKKQNVCLIILVTVIFLFSSIAFGFNDSTYNPSVNDKKPEKTKVNFLMGIAGIVFTLYGLQANTETFEWDFLTERYVRGSGSSTTDETYPDPDPYSIEYTWVKYEDIGPIHYEYTYNHHKKKQRTANIPMVVLGIALVLNAYQGEEEENFFKKEESEFFYSLNGNNLKVGYRSHF